MQLRPLRGAVRCLCAAKVLPRRSGNQDPLSWHGDRCSPPRARAQAGGWAPLRDGPSCRPPRRSPQAARLNAPSSSPRVMRCSPPSSSSQSFGMRLGPPGCPSLLVSASSRVSSLHVRSSWHLLRAALLAVLLRRVFAIGCIVTLPFAKCSVATSDPLALSTEVSCSWAMARLPLVEVAASVHAFHGTL